MTMQMFSVFLLVILISTAHFTAPGSSNDDGGGKDAPGQSPATQAGPNTGDVAEPSSSPSPTDADPPESPEAPEQSSPSGPVGNENSGNGPPSPALPSTESSTDSTTTIEDTTTTPAPPPPTCSNGGTPVILTSGETCDQKYITEMAATGGGEICCPYLVSKKLLSYTGANETILMKPARDALCQSSTDCSGGEVCEQTIWSDGKDLPNAMSHCYTVQCPMAKKTPELQFCTAYTECLTKKRICYSTVNLAETKVCCDVDPEYICPGGYYPKLLGDGCHSKDYTSPLPGYPNITRCCPRLASSTFKQKGINLQLPDFQAASTICKDSADCDDGKFCDTSEPFTETIGTGTPIKNCYKTPETYGEKPPNVELCQTHKECKTSGHLCDTKLGELNALFAGIGMCAKFKCPLYNVDKEPGQGVCQTDDDCKDEKAVRYCHPVGKDVKYKACCQIDTKHQCPGGLPPSKVKDILNHVAGQKFECNSEEFQYGNLCCPKIVSEKFATKEIIWEASYPLPTKECNKDPCGTKMFCDASLPKDPALRGKAKFKPRFCYKIPETDEVLTTVEICKKHAECPGDGQLCDKNAPKLAGNQHVDWKGHGLCSSVKCPLDENVPPSKGVQDDDHGVCQADKDCGDKHCHPVGKTKKYKACCSIKKEYMCPGALAPSKVEGIFNHEAGQNFGCGGEEYESKSSVEKKRICCPKMISDTFDKKSIVWEQSSPVTKCSKHSDCKGGGLFCDDSVPKDKTLRKETNPKPKFCYKIPETNGEKPANLEICKEHKECKTSGHLCDTKLGELKGQSALKGIGMCAKFMCPLDDRDLSKGGQDDGNGVCQADKDCGDKYCHPVRNDKKYKACCQIDKKYHCPGDLAPTRVKEKFNHETGQEFECEVEEFKWPSQNPTLCCRKLISKDLYEAGLRDIESKDLMTPCKKHADCKEANTFCGLSILQSSPTQTVNVNFCYEKPQCSGIHVVTGSPIGLKTCSDKKSCGENEACDLDFGTNNNGICCFYKCNRTMPEVTEEGIAKKICEGDCRGEEYGFCGKDLVNDASQVNVCEKTVTGKYRQCTYPRKTPPPPADFDSPVRTDNYALKPCSNDYDCRTNNNLMAKRSRCVGSEQNFLNVGMKKFCVEGDLCLDQWLLRTKEKVCTEDKECSDDQENMGKCQSSFRSTGEATKHCCPNAEIKSTVRGVDVINSYRSNVTCDKLDDCFGEKRFCDPLTAKCMYPKYDANENRKSKEKCGRDENYLKVCGGDIRKVCMVQDLGSDAKCYRHPWDECEKNSHCRPNQYCAPRKQHANVDAYNKDFRQCYTKPELAVTNEVIGLKECEKDGQCGDSKVTGNVCVSDKKNVTLPPNSLGYCKQAMRTKCRGRAVLSATGIKGLKVCDHHDDCSKTDEFCDKQLDQNILNGKGVCCTKPEKCGGTVMLAGDSGLKTCFNNGGCSLDNGEICSTKFSTGDIDRKDTRWLTNEGVCCQMTCPAPTDSDLEPAAPLAGALCEANNCQSESRIYKSCEDTKDTGEKRCCQYKRKSTVCPAAKADDIYLDAQSKAVACNNDKPCPKNSECIDGFCCIVNKCPDTQFRLKDQPTCTADNKCGQPFDHMAKCLDGHCCPVTSNGVIHNPFLSTKSCKNLEDCKEPRTFCALEQNVCGYFGNSDSSQESTKKCPIGRRKCQMDDGFSGVCTYGNTVGSDIFCWKDPTSKSKNSSPSTQTTEAPNEEEEKNSSTTTVVVIVVVLVVLLAAILFGGFFWYKHHVKKREEAKKRKQEKDRKEAEEAAKAKAAEKAAKEKTKSTEVQSERGSPLSAQNNLEPLRPQYITL